MEGDEAKTPAKLSAKERIAAQIKKEQQRVEAANRRARRLGAKLTQLSRSEDTHRKVVLGVWAQAAMEADAELKARIMRDLNRTLWRDDEREAFGLDKLTPEAQEHRRPKRQPKPAEEPKQ